MKKVTIVLMLLFGFIRPSLSQNAVIDSLHSLLSHKGNNRTRILIELTKENNIAGNYDAAVGFGSEAVSLAIDHGDSLEIVMAYRFKGAALRRLGRFDEALALILKANKIAKRNNFITETKLLLNSMALIYSVKAQYDLALDCNIQSLAIREAEGDQSEISVSLNNIGCVYYNLNNYEKALEYFNKSLEIKTRIIDNFNLEALLINIGLSESYLGSFDKSIDHFAKAFAVCENNCSDEIKLEGEFGLGVAYYNLKNFDVSKRHFASSYELSQKVKNQRFQSENMIYLGRLLILENDLSQAEKLFKESEKIAIEAGYNQLLLEVYKESFKLFSLKKDNKQEAFYKKRYFNLNDSLISVELLNNISIIQAGFEERQNVKNIPEQSELLKLYELIISKVRAQCFFILTITVLSLLLCFCFVRLNQKQQWN